MAFVIVSGMVWIYFRDGACYSLVPRKNAWVAIGVGVWIWLNMYEPLMLPVGLLILYLYSLRQRRLTSAAATEDSFSCASLQCSHHSESEKYIDKALKPVDSSSGTVLTGAGAASDRESS